jgi:uncharacterized membrane protein YfcA
MPYDNLLTNIFRSPVFILFGSATLALWLLVFYFTDNPADLLTGYWYFFFLGISGAIVANSTGAGGGVVFIPAFTSLGIDAAGALGTSIAIQCFGMTAGSISWLISIHHGEHGGKPVVKLTHKLLLYSGTSAVTGMLCGQYLLPSLAAEITVIFKYFSILFGFLLLLVTLRKNRHQHTRYYIRKIDVPLVIITCFIGGVVTSWISVGAGEFVALLLFLLGYPTMVSVCIAVCISSLTVLSGIPYHLFYADTVSWEILLFAAPAAIIGGSIARYLAERLGATRLKIFFATWILATGLAM